MIGLVKQEGGTNATYGIYDDKGKRIASINTGYSESQLIGFTSSTVTIKVLSRICIYNEKGQMTGSTSA